MVRHTHRFFFCVGLDFGVMGDNASHFDGGGTIANRCASGYKGQVVWWVWVMAEAFGGEHIGVKESEDLTLGE